MNWNMCPPYRVWKNEDTPKPSSPSPQEDSFNNKLLKTRNLLLSGEINKESAAKVINQLFILEADDPKTPVRLFIDSPGGDADAGFAVYDILQFISPPVYTIGMGLVASAAAIILLAAPKDRRIGLMNSHYLIHQPLSGGIRGVATEIEIHAKELEKLRVKINRLIASETGQDEALVQQHTDRDYWQNAEEAAAYGLIGKIVRKRDEL